MTHENNNDPNFDPHTHGTFSPKLTPVGFNEAIEILNIGKRRETKKNAIDIATESFVMMYMKGIFENNDELMYHMIENINQLVVEHKRVKKA